MKTSMIKKGDLVMIVGATHCCGSCNSIGKVFLVVGFSKSRFTRCNYCKKTDKTGYYGPEVTLDCGSSIEINRLKKIDPPSTGELDRVPVRMKEPA